MRETTLAESVSFLAFKYGCIERETSTAIRMGILHVKCTSGQETIKKIFLKGQADILQSSVED
uniref:Uncharacterized protein n=1 Tax=Romanomermis culicivorax TaxID=13658 RepID=A0A915IXY1_ROMCU